MRIIAEIKLLKKMATQVSSPVYDSFQRRALGGFPNSEDWPAIADGSLQCATPVADVGWRRTNHRLPLSCYDPEQVPADLADFPDLPPSRFRYLAHHIQADCCIQTI
jgi:hypothetical protein